MKSYISLLIFGLSLTSAALAQPEMAKQYITEILSQPEFKTSREESRWQYIGESSSKDSSQEKPERMAESTSMSFDFIGVIAQLFELVLWILLGVGIILFIIYGSRWLKQLRPEKTAKSDYTATPRLLDKGLKNAFLPTDISQQAWTLWQSGEATAALSLLYRGALSVLVTRDGLSIDESATENECLRLVRYKQAVELTAYFSGLTRVWQNIAYAGRLPSDVEAQRLCREWLRYFGKGK
ncbi:MAG: DUF4129 domain-containing protein [Pseudomonadota bacterium]